MKTLRARVVLIALALTLALSPTVSQAIPGNEPEPPAFGTVQNVPPPIQQAINNLFQSLVNKTITNANKVNEWKNQALAAANKSAQDFAGCPSNAAQNLYNDLKSKKTLLEKVIADATAADQQALQARTNCRNQFPGFQSACNIAYNNLPFVAIKANAQAALQAVNSAINVLKNLKCISGCNQTAKLVFPTVSVKPGPSQPGPTITVCTEWEPGQLKYNADSGNGELAADVYARLPKCKKTQTYPLTGCDWQVNLLLPVLKRLNIVPPSVQVGELSVNIPTQNVQVLSGFTNTCSQPLKICTQVTTGTQITFGLGADPIGSLLSAMQSVKSNCNQEQTIGCLNPPFGISPTFNTVQIPDPRRARISWSGGINRGSVTVDLTLQAYSVACKVKPLNIPGLPQITAGKQTINLPYLCLQPQWKNVVANQ
jgi:hypothetical protein